MKKMILWIIGIFSVLYLIFCSVFYFYQEKLIFYPEKIPASYRFTFSQPFQEHFIPAADGTHLHGVLFKADSSKGLVFFLHGNAGAVNTWGELASTYTRVGYDFFVLDYRGFGKSEGKLTDENQFFADVQTAYTYIKQAYAEETIVVIGFSIGTASAAMLAANNQPGRLILKAPYYSLLDLMQNISPVIYATLPPFLFKYRFKTYEFIPRIQAPITIFHGDKDYVIYYGSSGKLQRHLKPTDQVIVLPGQGHNGINENREYLRVLHTLLSQRK
ncbi:alpha/beta fold hydrolase [Rhodocytophaga aerolata]|uniref:Alpha/beta fold hydrolase n=1 Tax=Rhodocytophaga aerolata TaxID=455078 RepID=A0ABT8R3A5_9BACT|nr:alpha/beta fold hydrolase [Rhodocytophaga aerolata]MDO1446585.1 alpha/beta fold hydrolase [Rhodocytophaga aerolata]